jgi:hypothetical protein
MPWMRVFVAALIALASIGPASAVTFEQHSTDTGVPFIVVEGDFLPEERIGDFVAMVSEYKAMFVAFNSPGGNPYSATQLGRMIRALGLTTIQVRELRCESACSLAFMGGVERAAEPGSIGVHQSYFSPQSTLGRDDAVGAIQQLTGDVLSYFREMGIDPELLQMSLAYGSDDMRYLSASEMARTHVTTEANSSTQAYVAPSEAPAPPVANTETQALAFVERLINAHTMDAPSAISSVLLSYGQSVRYYGKQLGLADIISDKRAYFKRWPERYYQVRPATVSVSCRGTLCEVTGLYDWSVRSLPRNRKSSGTASFTYIVDTSGGMHVVGESSEVLSR